MQITPIKCEDKFKLASLGISPEACKQGNLSMESDRFICVKEAAADGTISFNFVDIAHGFKNQKKQMKGDAILMHPTKNIIAIRTGAEGSCSIQVNCKIELK
jgi:clathrin heavy chain